MVEIISSSKDLKQTTQAKEASMSESNQTLTRHCSCKDGPLSKLSGPSLQVMRRHSFIEKPTEVLPQLLPLPPYSPGLFSPYFSSMSSMSPPTSNNSCMSSPLQENGWAGEKEDFASFINTNEPFFDYQHQRLSLQASDINSPFSSGRSRDYSTFSSGRKQLSTHNLPSGEHVVLPSSVIRRPVGYQLTKLQVNPRPLLFSAPERSTSCPPPLKPYEKETTPSSTSHRNLVTSTHFSGDQISSVTQPVIKRSPIPSLRTNSSSGQGNHIHIQSGVHRKPESHKLPLPPGSINARLQMSTSPSTFWKKGRLIGHGTFGQVYLRFNSETGVMRAMKEVTLFSDDPKSKHRAQQLCQEIVLLSQLRHPNIVQYFGYEMVDDKPCIDLEYVSGQSISEIVQKYGQLHESVIRSYTKQILSGLVYLHSNHMVHRNIKGSNVLVDKHGHVKLGDFGMAKHITWHSHPILFKESPHWMAPEVIKSPNECGFAVDIWSVGCTVVEMATTKPPWSHYAGAAALYKIGFSKQCPPTLDHLTLDGKDFLRQCLQRNPQDRPTAMELLRHPFVSEEASPPPHLTTNNAQDYRGHGHGKTLSSLDLEGVAVQLGSKNESVLRNPHISKNKSCPVSPIDRPPLHPKASQPMFSSNPPISTSQTASGSSTFCTSVASPVNHLDHSLIYPR